MKKLILLLVLPSILLISCAKEETESAETIQDKLLRSYITVVHLDTLQPTTMGYYVMKINEGTGATPKIGDWIKWDQTQRYLDETVISVTEKSDAIEYNLFDKYMQTTHYVPNYGYLDENYIAQCLADVFPKMKTGAQYRLFVPGRFMSTKGSSTQTGSVSYILDIVLREVIEKPQEYELNQVLDYLYLNHPDININDSIKNGLYAKVTYTAPDITWELDSLGVLQPIEKDTASAVDGRTVYVTYVGRFLDGFVFDTNIIDSAKTHNIYDPSRAYDTLSFAIGNDNVVPGFEEIVKKLKTGDAGIGFFTSEWGYGIYGSSGTTNNYDEYGNVIESTLSSSIQSYTPLFFDVRLHRITHQ